jgi:uncharacterized protein YdhG (YjbR/CyaY superfamily)
LRLSPEVREILQKIRRTIRDAAPGAEETISYRIPAYKLHGVLVYFAAFKKHIGFYPPVRRCPPNGRSRYAGEKGNLQFPLDAPIPFDLIERIVKLKVKQNLAAAAAKADAPQIARHPRRSMHARAQADLRKLQQVPAPIRWKRASAPTNVRLRIVRRRRPVERVPQLRWRIRSEADPAFDELERR